MKFAAPAALALSMLFAGSAFGADAAAKPLTPQQQKMKDCNAQAKEKDLKGKEYTEFRNACLKGETPAAESAKPTTQQEKMTTCNAEAKNKGLKGKEYTAYRNNCLKGSPASSPATH